MCGGHSIQGALLLVPYDGPTGTERSLCYSCFSRYTQSNTCTGVFAILPVALVKPRNSVMDKETGLACTIFRTTFPAGGIGELCMSESTEKGTG